MNRQITSPPAVVHSRGMPDKGRITEEPCAIKVARTVWSRGGQSDLSIDCNYRECSGREPRGGRTPGPEHFG